MLGQNAKIITSVLLGCVSLFSYGDTEAGDQVDLSKVYITGGAIEVLKKPGSAKLIDELKLQEFEYSDIHRVLNSVPGVNLQEEDGYGLRPNIGLRGTSPERSKKITIMEDGVLIGPAPYSAPAAYYFPNVSRMSAVEVFKGPSTIQYGPATVGGAINMVSRPVPYSAEGEVDVQAGSDGFQKFNVYQGQQVGDFGYVVEALNVSADGFKDLDTGGDTGFERNDVLVKTQWQLMGATSHLFELKLGYADEQSNETYLGLTQADFDSDPYRRYAASQLDKTDWVHKQFQFTHVLEGQDVTISSDVYRNEFDRDWFKLNGFNSSERSISSVLADPTQYSDYYQVLTGEVASSDAEHQLRIGNNGREYISQGIQSRLNKTLYWGDIQHDVEVGIRLHQDEMISHHTEQNYDMSVGGALSAVDGTYKTTLRSIVEANAIALYIQDEVQFGKNTLTLGVRNENIESTKTTYGNLSASKALEETLTQSVLLPGIGLYREVNENLGLLGGIYKGFTAATPSGNENIEPEYSTNYELGLRYSDFGQSELICFINDYTQFSGTCSASQGSCELTDIGVQENAGSAVVYGLEASWNNESSFSGYTVPVSVTYTFSHGEFGENFTDATGAFGLQGLDIEKGFEIAYLPEHKLNVQIGLGKGKWAGNLSASYQSEMRNIPGEGSISAADAIDSHVVLDLSANYQLIRSLKVYGTVDNLMDEEYVVSAKPYGFRPGKPRSINIGAKYQF